MKQEEWKKQVKGIINEVLGTSECELNDKYSPLTKELDNTNLKIDALGCILKASHIELDQAHNKTAFLLKSWSYFLLVCKLMFYPP